MHNSIRIGLAAMLGSAVAACGGGGTGTGVQSTPTPPPSPPPTTPPPPAAPVDPVIFPAVTASTQFATLGYESAGHPIQDGSLVGSGFSVSYDAQSNKYFMDLPASTPGVVEATATGERYWNGTLRELSFGFEQQMTLNVFRPGPQNFDFPNLKYTSFAEYAMGSGEFGLVAFGSATPASAIPVTGNATYSAFAAGATDFGSAIRGNVTLQFNFGSGTLAGSFDPYIYDLLAGHSPLGHYDFVDTVFGVGSATWSGALTRSDTSERGTFQGQFTGPSAEELMARWTAPLPSSGSGSGTQMFGVWVGKRP